MTANVSTEKTADLSYRVVRLQAQNIKKLKAVDITPKPDADVVIVAGNNGEGKTSVLDSIMYALGGADAVAADPIRHGQNKATCIVDCGEFTATRTITPKGQTLELKAKNGKRIEQPQTFLDGLLGQLTFDPLGFSRLPARARVTTLLKLVDLPINLDEMAATRGALFDQRTDANRRKRDLEGELRELPEPALEDFAEPVDVGGLIAEKNRLVHSAQAVDMAKRAAAEAGRTVEDRQRRVNECEAALLHAKNELMAAEDEQVMANAAWAVMPQVDPSGVDAELAAAHETNLRRERAKNWNTKARGLKMAEWIVHDLSEKIEALDAEKGTALAAAQFPIDGLSFADGDVSFSGILFDQLSSAEQLRVSLAMAMAMNPRMRVIRITDGSLLDETSMGIVREMARDRGYQVWIECVGPRADATVIIEDGEVVANEPR